MDPITAFHKVFVLLNSYLWGWPLLLALVGVHLFLTIRLRFPQRHLLLALRLSFKKEPYGKGDVKPFRSMATALAATIGTGNIAGLAAAVLLGGPGALLWLWIIGAASFSTKYAESLLADKYRIRTRKGTMLGGPMYTIENGLNQKWLAVCFCICIALAALGIGMIAPVNSIAAILKERFVVDPWVSGLSIAVILMLMITGGIRPVTKACERIMPPVFIFVVLVCIILLTVNFRYILPAIAVIFKSAFTAHAACGGIAGGGLLLALQHGIAQGPFTIDAGFGTTPIAAAAGRSENPVRGALVSATGTFWHTSVFSVVAGLALVTGICRNPEAAAGLDGAGIFKTALLQIPGLGQFFWILLTAAFTLITTLGWSFYAERAVEYLFRRKAIPVFRYFWILAAFLGSFDKVPIIPLIVEYSILAAALMTVVNLASIVLLSNVAVRETGKYL